MIRKAKIQDLDRIMQIWLDSNIEAHDFIEADYWKQNFNFVKAAMKKADLFVAEENKQITAFVGMTGNYLAGIFVAKEYQNQGIGTKLIDYIKQLYPKFKLEVYLKNKSAVKFYLDKGLIISDQYVDRETGEKEYLMMWNRGEK